MTDKEKLYYLVKEYMNGNYTTEAFCDLFTVQYDIETDYSNLNEAENKCFNELSDITARFSSSQEDFRSHICILTNLKLKIKFRKLQGFFVYKFR